MAQQCLVGCIHLIYKELMIRQICSRSPQSPCQQHPHFNKVMVTSGTRTLTPHASYADSLALGAAAGAGAG